MRKRILKNFDIGDYEMTPKISKPMLTEDIISVVVGGLLVISWLAMAIGLPIMGLVALVKYVFGGG